MALAGFPQEKIDAAKAAAEPAEEFEVWPDNWRAWRLFQSVSTQWRTAPMGGVIGLDYGGVESAMRIQGVPRHKWRGLFADVQIMEAAAVGYFSEKKEDGK